MGHHENLKTLIQEEDLEGQTVEPKVLTDLYAQRFNKTLYPAHHASQEDKEPFCAKCRGKDSKKGELLLKMIKTDHGKPVYEVQTLKGEFRFSQHDVLKEALDSQDREVTRDELENILIQLGLDEDQRSSLFKNLYQHVEGGACRACQTDGPLLKRLKRNTYINFMYKQPNPSQTFLKKSLPVNAVVRFLKSSGVWDSVGIAFIDRFDPLSPEILKYLDDDTPMVWSLFKLKGLENWKMLLQLYQKYIHSPALELTFYAVVPVFVKEKGAQHLGMSAFFRCLYRWFIGESRDAYRELFARLNTTLPSEDELKSNIVWLQEQVECSPSSAVLTRIFSEFPQRMGWAGIRHDDINAVVLTTAVLGVLWPERYLIISKHTLLAFDVLRQGPTTYDLPEVTLEKSGADLSIQSAVAITQWSQRFVEQKNQLWQSNWLTPRKLDMLLYSCRGYLKPTYKRILYSRSKELPMDPKQLEQSGIQLTTELFGQDFERYFVLFKESIEELQSIMSLDDLHKNEIFDALNGPES